MKHPCMADPVYLIRFLLKLQITPNRCWDWQDKFSTARYDSGNHGRGASTYCVVCKKSVED